MTPGQLEVAIRLLDEGAEAYDLYVTFPEHQDEFPQTYYETVDTLGYDPLSA